MYMALTEEQGKKVRKTGISVIEWKWCIRNNINATIYAINKVAEKVAWGWKQILDVINDFVDIAKLAIETIKEKFHYHVSRRYKFVKVLGAMGYDKQRVWSLTRHTWLARSNC